MKALLFLLFSLPLFAQTPAPSYQYWAHTGATYDWIARSPASVSGIGLRIASSNAFNVWELSSSVVDGLTVSTITTGLEYQVACTSGPNGWCFLGLADGGITTSGGITFGNFSGGFGLSYDFGRLVSRGRFSLFAVPELRVRAISATSVKPVYALTFRKVF